MKKPAYSKVALRKIKTEAKRHVEKGIVLYLNVNRGVYGYQARLYSFPGEFGEKDRGPHAENFGKFYKTKFFAKHKYETWKEAAEAAKQWLEDNKPSKDGEL